MDALGPDRDRRAEIEAELPETPLTLYEAPLSQPVGWRDTPAGFLLLSDAYRWNADRASTLGWPVIEHRGTQFDIVNHPEPLARHLVEPVL
jgi:hypothetical protein